MIGVTNESKNSFIRNVGYAQQHDLHLQTMTAREAMMFSARLLQSRKSSDIQKANYVNEVIEALGMAKLADTILGEKGQGLSIEQRKRVTIGVELAAQPDLLLLDEPTSGLDTSTAWSICRLLRHLSKSGLAVLCTIHQPSSALF